MISNHKITFPFITIILSTIFLLQGISATAASSLPGHWQPHPSFFRQSELIIDGPQYTYLLLHQQYFNSNYPDCKDNHASLFRWGKTPDAKIKAISEIFPYFPTAIRTATYSPFSLALIAASEKGDLWVIPDDGAPYQVKEPALTATPGQYKINSLTVNPIDGKVWAATSYGYTVIDLTKRKVEERRSVDKPLDWVCAVGNHIIAFSDSEAFEITDQSTSALTPLPIVNALNLMPLTENTFAYLTASDSSTNHDIRTATFDGQNWVTLNLLNDRMQTANATATPLGVTHCCSHPNEKGYYIAGANFSYQLLKDIDPDLSSSDPALDFREKIIKTINRSGDSWRKSSSWDFREFALHIDLKGFYRRSYINSKWQTPTERIFPDAPASFQSTSLIWHPQYGLLVSGRSFNNLSESNISRHPWLISSLKDNKWHNLSPVHYVSDELKSSGDFINLTAYYYPLTDATGFAIDPNNPDYAFAGSLVSGWARVNLSSPADPPLHVGNEADYARNLPGFIEAYPTDKEWKIQCNFTTPSFDAEGRLWTLFRSNNPLTDTSKTNYLHYYTPADLKAILRAGSDPSEFIPTRQLPVQLPRDGSQWAMSVALCHPSNQNLILLTTGNYGDPLYVFDHNGTPDMTDDDNLIQLDKLYDPTGGNISLRHIISIYEDSDTGDVWLGTDSGPVMIRPYEASNNPRAALRPGTIGSQSSSKLLVELESIQVNAFARDNYNRLWIGTNERGLIVLSPDRNSIITELSTRNTPLPSDRIYGLCYNPERHSMMISSFEGLTEFFPDDMADASDNRVKIMPSTVSPSYAGSIRISGLTPGAEVEICSQEGGVIARFTADDNGNAMWDGRRDDHSRFNTGTYTLRYTGKTDVAGTIRVLN